MRVLPYLLALALGLGAAGLTACGSKSSDALIPSSQAGPLKQDFDRVQAAVADGDCVGASNALDTAQNHLNDLSSRVDERLRTRLQDGITALDSQAQAECQAAQTTTETTATTDTTTTETTSTDTTSTETLPTDTTTLPTDTTTIPTDTTTIPTDTTTIPTTTVPSGGATDTTTIPPVNPPATGGGVSPQ